MSAATETRYWVRAAADAPEKGPFTVAQIKDSHAAGRLKGGALIRLESAEESDTRTVKDLVDEGVLARAKMLSTFKQQDAEREVQRERSGGSTNMLIGGACFVLGIGITVVSYSSASEGGGGGRYVVLTGLIVFGLFRFIRGAAQR